jgi:D-alanyl-D-alanine carboxypeptidase (penicillin-binding protein 5/6)
LLFAVLFNIQATGADSVPTGNSEQGLQNDGTFVLGGIPPSSDIVSDSVYVYNMDTGAVVYSRNADKRVWPASTTKIMTALVVLENERNLDRAAEFPRLINDEFVSGDPNKRYAATAGFDFDCDITLLDALYGMMLPSGCEAANILAYNIGQGEQEERIPHFIGMMNELAAKIGAKDTNFSNAHGLFEPENYSTAYDMFLITKYAYDKHRIFFSDLVSTVEYAVPISEHNPDGVVVNTNFLLRAQSHYYYEFARGVKTGGFDSYYTRHDGEWVEHSGLANLVSIAQRNMDRDSFQYLIVTMNAPWLLRNQREEHQQGLHHAFNDHRSLYSWAFSTFNNTNVLRTTDPVAVIKVIDGEADEVQLFPLMDRDFWTLLPDNLDVNSAINRVKELASDECTCDETQADECKCDIREGVVSAPIERGDILGTVELVLAGQSLAKFPLIAGDSVARTTTAEARDILTYIFGQWWFRLLLLLIAAATIALIIFSYILKHRKKLQQARRKPPNRRIRR